MIIKFYNTSSSNNTINKVLENEIEYDIKLKETTDLRYPTIVIRSDTMITSNYAYIDRFKRYYFIENIEVYPNSIYHIKLRCDVLETYKEQLLKCDGLISQQVNTNKYYDGGYRAEVRKEVEIYKSNVTLPDVGTMLLTSIGG